MSGWLVAFDDSGAAHPRATSEFFATAAVAVPLDEVRTLGQRWNDLVRKYVPNSPAGPIELKSSDSYDAWRRTRGGHAARPGTLLGQSTHDEIDAAIKAAWQFLASPQCSVTYLAAAFHKEAYWTRFANSDYLSWQGAQDNVTGNCLKLKLEQDAFYFLVERIQYLMEEVHGLCVVLGDESSSQPAYYSTHSIFGEGNARYTDASRVVTTVTFGSSVHSPVIQIADWIGFAVATWCRGLVHGQQALRALLPRFRGYPDNILGRGILLKPGHDAFPTLPL